MNKPKFLASKKTVIKVEERLSIARKEGNLILDFNSNHLLECSFENKEVRTAENAIYINNVELEPNTVKELHLHDVLKINGEEYTIFDDTTEIQSLFPKSDRRKRKRPKNAYAPINFVNFYCAPPWALVIYFSLFGYALSRFVFKMHLNVPDHLSFLGHTYNQRILTEGLKLVGITWLFCLLHSLFMYLYFNRNPLRRTFITALLIIASIASVNQIFRPLEKIKTYVLSRELIQQYEPHERAIVGVMQLIDSKYEIVNSYGFLHTTLAQNDQKVFQEDFESNMKKIQSHLKGKSN